MDDAPQMGVVEFEDIRADCIEKRSGERIRLFRPADHRRLSRAEERTERPDRQLDRDVTATAERRPDEIHDRPPGLVMHCSRHVVPLRLDEELRELPGRCGHRVHPVPHCTR
jgi:hypothetical protein